MWQVLPAVGIAASGAGGSRVECGRRGVRRLSGAVVLISDVECAVVGRFAAVLRLRALVRVGMAPPSGGEADGGIFVRCEEFGGRLRVDAGRIRIAC